jgi:hypothetical protein
VLSQPHHTNLEVSKANVPHPRNRNRYNERAGQPQGQLQDFGRGLADGRGIHIKEYDNHFKIHWDKRHPGSDPIGHITQDAPLWGAIGVVTTGAVAMSLMSNS